MRIKKLGTKTGVRFMTFLEHYSKNLLSSENHVCKSFRFFRAVIPKLSKAVQSKSVKQNTFFYT